MWIFDRREEILNDVVTVVFGVILVWARTTPALELTTTEELCDDELFTPECAENEAIVMNTAVYGRMRVGKCVDRSFEHMPCMADVLGWLDAWCSGRRYCSVDVADINKEGVRPCPRDFRSYLRTSYDCVTVIHVPGGCTSGPYIVREPTGYLSRLVTQEHNCGSFDAPWQIKTSPGQEVNITLFDFSTQILNPRGLDTTRISDVCMVYAVVKELGGVSKTVCGGRGRVQHVMRSSSRDVEVRLVKNRSQDEDEEVHYMIKYQVLGCPDPDRQGGQMSFERHGSEVVVSCKGGSRLQRVTCVGARWSPAIMNCTASVVDTNPTDSTRVPQTDQHVISKGGSPVLTNHCWPLCLLTPVCLQLSLSRSYLLTE